MSWVDTHGRTAWMTIGNHQARAVAKASLVVPDQPLVPPHPSPSSFGKTVREWEQRASKLGPESDAASAAN